MKLQQSWGASVTHQSPLRNFDIRIWRIRPEEIEAEVEVEVHHEEEGDSEVVAEVSRSLRIVESTENRTIAHGSKHKELCAES